MTGTIEQLQIDAPVRIEIDTQGDNFLAYGESMEILARSLKVGRILQTQLDNGLSEGIVEIPPMMKLGISSIRISTVQ